MNNITGNVHLRSRRRSRLSFGPPLGFSSSVALPVERENIDSPRAGLDQSSSNEEVGSGLSNISTQAFVSPTSGPMIAGFVIRGAHSKRILLRAAGPTLAELGLTNWLAYPRIRLFDATGVLVGESSQGGPEKNAIGWSERVGAFPFRPGSRDAALFATLGPGAYTAHVSSDSNAARGISVVEAYDLTRPGETPGSDRFVNLSTLARVSSADRALVTRFTVSGNSPRRLLIRGVGPGLSNFGVNDCLVDPQLELYSPSALIAANENWETQNRAELSALNANCGAFPLQSGSRDTALIVTLDPCAYTIVLRSSGGLTGRGLIEVYDAPERQ